MKTYLFQIPGEPFAKQRAITTRTGHSFTPKKTVMYENLVKTCFTDKYGYEEPTQLPVSIRILAVYSIPQSWSKKNKILASLRQLFPRKHDFDNVAKIVCDGLQGVAIHNDNQIFLGTVMKIYGDVPGVTVEMKAYEQEDLERLDLWQGLTT